MDEGAKRNIDFAREGIGAGNFVYSAEICRFILLKEPGCVEALRVLQIASKGIYDERSFVRKMGSKVGSFVALFSAYVVPRKKRMVFLQRALWRCPRNKVGLILLAQCALEEGCYEMMLFAYEELHLLFPEDARFALALGDAYLNFGNYEDALKIGEKLLEKDPSNTEAMSLVEAAALVRMRVVK